MSGKKSDQMIGQAAIKLIEFYRTTYRRALSLSSKFLVPKPIEEIAHEASTVVSLGNQTGEGWLLTGEMVELIENGVKNIICMQPFACLPNHVTGKGMIKELKRIYPGTNIVAVDYDPGASEVNQLNRIKLMIYRAFENIRQGCRDDGDEGDDEGDGSFPSVDGKTKRTVPSHRDDRDSSFPLAF